MRVDGQCHCGHVRFEAEVLPERVTVCHCTDCQSISGSFFRVSVAAEPQSIRFTANPPKRYVKTAESGRPRNQYFCPECGSALFASTPGEETTKVWNIRWGAIRQRAALVPRRQIWCRSAVGWLGDVAALPAKPTD